MPTDFAQLIKAYGDLAKWWTDSMSTHWADMSTRIQAGSYGVEDAASDAAYCVALNTLGLLGAANETMEATGVLVYQPGATVTKAPGRATAPSTSNRGLHIYGDFAALVGGGKIPKTDISPVPSILPAGQVDFQVSANTSGHYASSYSGYVQVGDLAAAPDTEVVAVTLIVQ